MIHCRLFWTEILVVHQGTLFVGFVTSNQVGNRLFTKTLNMGDVFVFPEGFIHFQFNVGRSPAVAFAALSSQNPGVISIVNTVFGSNPPTNLNVLAKGFQLDPRVAMLMDLQAKILIMKYEIVCCYFISSMHLFK